MMGRCRCAVITGRRYQVDKTFGVEENPARPEKEMFRGVT